MPTCIVPGCGRGPTTTQAIRLHTFPNDEATTLKIWKERIASPRLENIDDASKVKSFICDRHFIKECHSPGTRRLKKYSLPTIGCPGFKGEATIENSFLLPPKKLTSDKQDKIDTRLQPQPQCSKESYPIFVDLTDFQEEEEIVIKIENEDEESLNQELIDVDDNSSCSYTLNFADVQACEKVIEEIEFQDQEFGIFDSSINNDPLYIDNGMGSNFDIRKGRSRRDISSEEKRYKKIKKMKNELLLKYGPYSRKFIHFARNHLVPRRFNVCKPVGFSNRQRLAWRIFFCLKGPKKMRTNRKLKVNNNKDENMNHTVLKFEVIKPREIKSCNTTNSVLNKGHFRAIDDYVRSKNFSLLAARIGINPWTVKLLSLQMKTKLFCPLSQKFTVEDKIFSLSYYKKFGPKKYRELSEFCALPPPKSLSDLMVKIPFSPGVHQQVFDNLKSSTLKLDDSDKYCSIIFQEIPLVMEQSATVEEEMLITDDEDEKEKLCKDDKPKGDNVVVVMLRGLNRDWRQPVAFEVTTGKIKSFDLAALLRKVIIQSLSAGFRVIAVIFNKKESYSEALSLLNSESLFPVIDDDKCSSLNTKHIDIAVPSTSQDRYPEAPKKSESIQFKIGKKSDPIWNTGYVLNFGNHEISLLYNPANLLRIVRNKWLTYDISFTENGKVKQASWNHVLKLYAADEGDEDTKFCPKLTSRHVNATEIDKGSTRCCTQVFSQRASSIMRRLASLRVCGLDNAALETADLLLFFDKLFDSVNGTSKVPQKGKTLRSSVSAGSPHRDFWRSATPILASMSFLTPFKEESKVFNLWLATLGSLHRLCDRLIVHKGLPYLPLGHLNCDPLENFIRCGLKLGAYSIRPTYNMFHDSFKTLLFCGDDIDSDIFQYQIHQLDSLRNYIYDEVPSTLLGV